MSNLISFVVPVLNEVENIELLCQRVDATMWELRDRYSYEVIFTDNHSSDGSYKLLTELAKDRPYIRVIRFSKNIGYQLSILTGYLNARGVVAIQLDADLQDPPELVPEFLEKWEEGNKIVYGIREFREESWLNVKLRQLFYRLMYRLSNESIPPDAGDFRLVDRDIIELLSGINDRRPYLRGVIASFGFKQAGVPYRREKRTKGESKFPYRTMTKLAIDGVVNHSDMPLRLATKIGVIISIISFVIGVGYLIGKIIYQQEWAAGFATTVLLILVSLGILSFLLGIIGEYLGRIYEQLRRYPHVIVEEAIDGESVGQKVQPATKLPK